MGYANSMKGFLLVCFCLVATSGWAAHGISLDGQVKYPRGFRHFDYASEKAVKGGTLVLHDIGSFDKLNPFTLKGEAPLGLETLVFEPLAVASLDEPFSQYGVLAADIEVAGDQRSVTFTLDPRATFSTGEPVRAEDVAFTLETLKSEKAHPFMNYYYQDIARAEILAPDRVRLHFAKVNRELHVIAGQMRIMSKRFYQEHGFAANSDKDLEPPLASGPYVVTKVDLGKSITYQRNPRYWAVDHPTRRGMYNYDEIVVKYYKDQTVALEAFKAGEFDFISINIAKQWAKDMEGKRFADGTLIKKTFPHANNAGMQGFVMNTRRSLFTDVRVRQALGLTLDFEWINASLFHSQYTRSNSFFSNSPLAATGLPQGLELRYLEPYRQDLPGEVFTLPLSPPTTSTQGIRKNLMRAKTLLAEAGWRIVEGRLVNERGERFAFDILLASPAFERVMAAYVDNLQKLGITAEYRVVDQALYGERLKTFDFDMIVATYGQSQSPGNEQRNFWHSSSADRPGSQNYAGIASPVVDALIDKIIYATSREELIAGCRALDRVLWYGYYLVPNWYLPTHRLGYRDIFLSPDTLPLYYDPMQLLLTWWIKPVGVSP